MHEGFHNLKLQLNPWYLIQLGSYHEKPRKLKQWIFQLI